MELIVSIFWKVFKILPAPKSWPPSASPNVSGATPFQEIPAAGRWQDVELGKQEGREEVRELALEEGRRREACTLARRLLEHRCGSLIAATTPRIEALSRAQLKNLTLALLDFHSGEDLHVWLEHLEA